jgi:hypothetical protein
MLHTFGGHHEQLACMKNYELLARSERREVELFVASFSRGL